jgi:hypothetical protein
MRQAVGGGPKSDDNPNPSRRIARFHESVVQFYRHHLGLHSGTIGPQGIDGQFFFSDLIAQSAHLNQIFKPDQGEFLNINENKLRVNFPDNIQKYSNENTGIEKFTCHTKPFLPKKIWKSCFPW